VPGLYTIPSMGGEVSGPLATSDTTTSAYAQFRGAYDMLDPSWSPDGSRIAFVRLEDGAGADIDATPWRIHVMNADGTDPRRIEVSADSDDEYRPAWSPDGTRIGLQGLDADPTMRNELGRRAAQVAVVAPDGSEEPWLSEPIAYQSNPGNPNATDFLWSPDSTTMLISEAGRPSGLLDFATGLSTELSWEATGGWSWQPLFHD
jgi:Tol biopolymer transport system component